MDFDLSQKTFDSLREFGWPIKSDWTRQLTNFFESPNWQSLVSKIQTERRNETVYPSVENTFRAFELTPYSTAKVVILGQDPYHGEGQAHGLCFSVTSGIKPPPSLRNILKELNSDLNVSDSPIDDGKKTPSTPSGNLEAWARQGVFLLNTVLTVRKANANSHAKHGWLKFTDFVIQKLSEREQPLVFLLWGKPAEKKQALIDSRHFVLTAPHPSPLSAHRGFFGSKPFSRINEILESLGSPVIDWQLENSSLHNDHSSHQTSLPIR